MSDDVPRSMALSLDALGGMTQPQARVAEIAADLPPLLARVRAAVDRIATFEDEPYAFPAAQTALRP